MTGPFDESDEVNHDPDSMAGDEDEAGFDEMAEWPEWQVWLDDGFDDAEGGEDEEEDGEEE